MVEVALLSVAVLVILLTLGVPLPWCFGAALMTMNIVGGVTMRGQILWVVDQLANPILVALPLFVLSGSVMSASGIAQSLLNLVNVFVGHIRGGLGVVAAVS
ncbi:MAG: TRAP transporter large permease subunit, partial [Alphaproteobacteria bacterium]|nr:TRAP transporter large permease subunit [Alphaproteobacteria bacterium]